MVASCSSSSCWVLQDFLFRGEGHIEAFWAPEKHGELRREAVWYPFGKHIHTTCWFWIVWIICALIFFLYKRSHSSRSHLLYMQHHAAILFGYSTLCFATLVCYFAWTKVRILQVFPTRYFFRPYAITLQYYIFITMMHMYNYQMDIRGVTIYEEIEHVVPWFGFMALMTQEKRRLTCAALQEIIRK